MAQSFTKSLPLVQLMPYVAWGHCTLGPQLMQDTKKSPAGDFFVTVFFAWLVASTALSKPNKKSDF